MILLLIIFLSALNLSYSVEIKKCGTNNVDWVCVLGENCVCEIEGDCTDGNIAVFYTTPADILCYPKIKDGTASIDLVLCDINKNKINVTAICQEGVSNSKQINVLFEKPPACIWNETTQSCQKNKDPLAERCGSEYSCILVEDSCECKRNTTTRTTQYTQTTILMNISTTANFSHQKTRITTTTRENKPCPYECCDNFSGYDDLECDEGYVCCPKGSQYYCKSGNSCFETKKPSGFSGWLLIIIIIMLSVIGGAVYYISKTKVNLMDKYRI